jgi:hypothetical protein
MSARSMAERSASTFSGSDDSREEDETCRLPNKDEWLGHIPDLAKKPTADSTYLETRSASARPMG